MAQPVRDWAKEIEKRTNGRVKITVYLAGTLTSPAACYEGVVRGQSDIGEVVLSMTRGRFPLMEAVELPGFPFNAIVSSKVSHEFYRKFKPKELDETHLLYLHSHIPGAFHTRTKAVRKLEDLKGLRVRCTGLSAKIVQALGATPVTMPKGETYDALSRGLVDAAMGAPNDQTAFKLSEVSKYCTLYAPAGNVATFATVINKAKWDSLPPDIQKIFTDVSEEWVEHTGKVWNAGELETFQFFKNRKEERFIVVPAQEGARWDKALEPIFDDYKKDMKAKGLPGEEALKYRQELIDKYSKMYPPLKTN
jgi:TRAP-type C4-dicarboxylate transport system substrate-binding protein